MNIADILILLVIVGILGAAVLYVYKAKKAGKKCIGCPESCGQNCKACKGNCQEKQ